MIELQNVNKSFGPKKAVCDLSLGVRAGETLAFLGPNGAGKTTTIKMMVGLLRPDSGQLTINGLDVIRNAREASRLTGFVPDEPYLYDKLTGREFLQFICGMYGMDRLQTADAIDQQVESFELHEFIDRLAETYSHGMKQRLVFAAALVHDPPLVILDEPMVGLDPRNMRHVKDLLSVRTQSQNSVFMSTHTLSLVEELADRIAVIHEGRLRFVGTVAELKESIGRQHDNSLEELFLELTDPGSPSQSVGRLP